MKADLRISTKDERRAKTLKILLFRTPFSTRQFYVRMNGQRWPGSGKPGIRCTGLVGPVHIMDSSGFHAGNAVSLLLPEVVCGVNRQRRPRTLGPRHEPQTNAYLQGAAQKPRTADFQCMSARAEGCSKCRKRSRSTLRLRKRRFLRTLPIRCGTHARQLGMQAAIRA
jgi:hypothetical protein